MGDPCPAGSIPVHLRHSRSCPALVAGASHSGVAVGWPKAFRPVQHEYPNVTPVDPLAVLRVAAVNRTTGRKHGFELIGGGGAGHNIDLGGAVPQLDVRFGSRLKTQPGVRLPPKLVPSRARSSPIGTAIRVYARLPGFAANRREVDDGQTGQQFGGGRRVAGELVNGTVDRLDRLRKRQRRASSQPSNAWRDGSDCPPCAGSRARPEPPGIRRSADAGHPCQTTGDAASTSPGPRSDECAHG